MPESDIFKHFDPLESMAPPDFEHAFYFDYALLRARHVLHGKTRKQINALLELAAWLIEEQLSRMQQRQMENCLTDAAYSEPQTLLLAKESGAKIPALQTLPTADWPDLFAALTLAICASAVQRHEHQIAEPSNPLIDSLVEAVEAAAIASALKLGDTKMRTSSSRGGSRRSDRYSKLREFVRAQWSEHYRSRSNRQAAKGIWDIVPTDQKALLTSDEPEKTLERWIARFKQESESA